MNNLILPQSTKDFVNAVTNPFDCSVPARIPDNDISQSLSLKDYIAQNGINILINGTTTVCSGVAIGMVIGFNQMASAGLITQAPYTIYVIPLSTGGVPIGTSVLSWTNYASLGTYSLFYRFVGGGLRVKCLIEDVTTSTTIAVSRMYSGMIKNFEVWTAINAGTNLYNLANQMDCLKIYNNAEGTSMRIDPFQQIDDFKKYRATLDWDTQACFNGNTYIMPLTVIQFMNPVVLNTVAGNTTYSFPLIVESILWIEGLLLKPSPLFVTPSPCDLSYTEIAEIIGTQCGADFPLVSKFNSFTNFLKSIGRLGKSAVVALGNSSVLPVIGNLALNGAISYATGRPSNLNIIKKRRKKRASIPIRQKPRRRRGPRPYQPMYGNNFQKPFKGARTGRKSTRM